MDFFKSKAGALLLAVLVVAGSTLLNTRVKLGSAVNEIEDKFYTDIEGERSIYSRLEEKLSASTGYAAVLSSYDKEAADALYEERDSLLWATEGDDIDYMAYCSESLDRAFDEAQRSLAGYELSEGDVSDAKYYAEIYEGAQKMITENSYNSAVTDFTRSVYNTFPTDILAELAGVDEPQRFS